MRNIANKTALMALTLMAGLALRGHAATFVIVFSDDAKKPVLLESDSTRGSITQTGTQAAQITVNGPSGTTARGDGQTITDSFEIAAANGTSLSAQGSTTEPYSGPPVMFIGIQSYDYEDDPLTCAQGEISECTLKEAFEGALVNLGKITWSDGSFDTVYVQPPLKKKKAPAPPPVPAWLNGILRASMTIAGPITPPPGSPVEATVSFTDLSGNLLGQPTTVPLFPGQVASVDFNANLALNAAGLHANVIPVISAPANGWLPPLQLTTEGFDSATGIGWVLTNATASSDGPSGLGVQGVAAGETIRISAMAIAPNSCVATLSFADGNGNRVGSALSVDLAPGQGNSLDLTAQSLSIAAGRRVQIQPILTVQTQAGVPQVTTCAVASEVFDQATGHTRTYQTGAY